MVSLGLKLKMAKTSEPNSTGTLQLFCGKILRENTKYSRNERILKIGHLAKAIAHVKAIGLSIWSVSVQKLKMPKTCEKPFYKNSKVVLCKKPFEKTPNIREMRQF